MSEEAATTVLTTEPAATGEEEATEATATPETTEQSTEAAATEAQGTETEAEAHAGAPEEYADFTVAEGMTLDNDLLAEFVPMAKELNLPQEKAQALVDMASKLVQKQAAAQQETFRSTVDGWVNAAKTDKEFGGDKFAGSIEVAQRALNSFATPELKEALNTTGLGNHPEMIRLMVRIGNAMKEDDRIVTGTTPPQSAPKSAAEILFGNPPKDTN